MRRVLIPLLCLLAIGTFAVTAHASALSALYPYTINQLEDQDWEFLLDLQGADNIVDQGDLLQGVFFIDHVVNTNGGDDVSFGPGDEHFVGVFLIQCVAKFAPTDVGNPSPGSYFFAFAPTSAANWAAYAGLAISDPGTMAMVFGDDDFNADLGFSSFADSGNRFWEFGFTNPAGGPMANEFWIARTPTDDITQLPSGGINANNDFFGALGVTANFTGVGLLPHGFLTTNIGTPPYVGTNALQFNGTFQPQTEGVGYFDAQTDGDYYIYPTPEPGSLALLGLGLAACGAAVYRRRRKA